MEIAFPATVLLATATLFAVNEFIPYPAPLPIDVPLVDVCGYSCAFGNTAVASCVYAGRCQGVGSECDGGWGHDVWLTAHRDCAQPRFWPWLITAVTGTWALMDDGDPLKGLLLAAFTLMSLGLVRPYWCTLAVFFVVLGAMHFRSARSRKSVKKFEHTNLTRWLVIAPVKTAMQIFVFVGGVGEYNTIVFAVVAVLIVERAVGACVVQWLFRAKHEACSLPASTAVDALMLTVVSVFFALNVPFNWFVWPLYLCWLVYSVPLVEATKT